MTEMGGFDTEAFSEGYAHECAKRCVEFQMSYPFRYLVAPTRYLPGMPDDYIGQQSTLFVDPFIDEVLNRDLDRPVALQLVLSEHMVREERFRDEILDWATGLQRVDAVYLIVANEQPEKQVKDPELLYAHLDFIRVLRENDMEVVLGYLNTEAFLLTVADPTIITMGSYENTRIWNQETFIPNDEERRGPNPRVYFPGLLQHIEYQHTGSIKRVLGDDILTPSPHEVEMFVPTYKWWSTKPEPYKHFFFAFAEQLAPVQQLTGRDRYVYVKDAILEAWRRWNELENRVFLDRKSDGSHLGAWLTALVRFGEERGWETN
jgi:hypothetical protein